MNNKIKYAGLKPSVFPRKRSLILLRFAPGCRSSLYLKTRSILDREIKWTKKTSLLSTNGGML
jgi:hypothetical protein